MDRTTHTVRTGLSPRTSHSRRLGLLLPTGRGSLLLVALIEGAVRAGVSHEPVIRGAWVGAPSPTGRGLG